MVIINRLRNMFRNKEWNEAWKYKKFGCRRSEYDDGDYIWEQRTPVLNVKCNYYQGKEKVER